MKANTPFISVVVPNFNHSAFLEQRINSIICQTFKNFEIILLDDASRDGSLEILKKFSTHPKVSYFISNKSNSGSPIKQWEKGLKLAEGEYIWIAESDDFCSANFLQELVEFLELNKKSNIGIVYSQSFEVNEVGEITRNRIRITERFFPNIWKSEFIIPGLDFVKSYLSDHNVIPNASAVIFKRELITEDFWKESMLLQMTKCGDWFFWIKICQKTNIGFLPLPLNYFRFHLNTTRGINSRQMKLIRLKEEAIIRKYLTRFKVDQTLQLTKLQTEWFSLFTKLDIFKKNFYEIAYNKSYLSHLLKFIWFKINGRIS